MSAPQLFRPPTIRPAAIEPPFRPELPRDYQAPPPFSVGTAAATYTLQLAAGAAAELGDGHGIHYLRGGSAAGGILAVTIDGTTFTMRPGDFLKLAPFKAARVARATGSAVAGLAAILVYRRADVAYSEPAVAAGSTASGGGIIDILGTSAYGAGAFVAIAEDVAPTVVADGFGIGGVRRIRVLMDGQSGGVNATAWNLRPWVWDGANGLWFAQSGNILAVPDSSPTGARYRCMELELSPSQAGDRLYFEVTDLLVAARTTVGFIVQQTA